ncbi:hypothetical protein V6N13_050808 [Hibiscus sabdariffa]
MKHTVVPKFALSFLDGKETFKAGETAAIRNKVVGNFDGKGNASLTLKQIQVFARPLDVSNRVAKREFDFNV